MAPTVHTFPAAPLASSSSGKTPAKRNGHRQLDNGSGIKTSNGNAGSGSKHVAQASLDSRLSNTDHEEDMDLDEGEEREVVHGMRFLCS
jgi:hypothetical protein